METEVHTHHKMADEGKNLVEEIYDEFLVCKICMESYKNPKTLNCLHVFCCECLEKHNETEMERSTYRYMTYLRNVSCPICRKKTDLPSGGISRLPENFLVSNLSEVVDRRRPGAKLLCQICPPTTSNKATSKCLECVKLLCKHCVQTHRQTNVTENHGLFDIGSEKDVMCKVHDDEPVRFYCEPCEACICVLCTFLDHKDHDVSTFTEGMNKYGRVLEDLVDTCKGKIERFRTQIDLITTCADVMKAVEDHVRDSTINLIAAIRNNEKKLLNEIQEAFGENTRDFIDSKVYLQESLDNMLSTCNLTDIIINDKGIELLLLKKDIENKLELLLNVDVPTPPMRVNRKFHYVPSEITYGYIKEGVAEEVGPTSGENCNVENQQSVEIQTENPKTYNNKTSMGKNVSVNDKDAVSQTETQTSNNEGEMLSKELNMSPTDLNTEDIDRLKNNKSSEKQEDIKIYDDVLKTVKQYKGQSSIDGSSIDAKENVTDEDKIMEYIKPVMAKQQVIPFDKILNTGKRNRPKLTSSISVDDSVHDHFSVSDALLKSRYRSFVDTDHKCVGTVRKMTADCGIGTACVLTMDKETGTPYIHQIHRNTSTDNMCTADKQTNTSTVASAYRQLIAAPHVNIRSRATNTDSIDSNDVGTLTDNQDMIFNPGNRGARSSTSSSFVENKDGVSTQDRCKTCQQLIAGRETSGNGDDTCNNIPSAKSITASKSSSDSSQSKVPYHTGRSFLRSLFSKDSKNKSSAEK